MMKKRFIDTYVKELEPPSKHTRPSFKNKGRYMFTKPLHGWTNLYFESENFSERASYLTDIPIECLDAFIYALENNVPTTIFFDAEGYDYHLVASYYCSYIILDKDNSEVINIDKNVNELAMELVYDIDLYFEDWVNWESWDDESEDEIKKRRNELKEKLEKLKFLLVEYY